MILRTIVLKSDVSAKMQKMSIGGKKRFISLNLSFQSKDFILFFGHSAKHFMLLNLNLKKKENSEKYHFVQKVKTQTMMLRTLWYEFFTLPNI